MKKMNNFPHKYNLLVKFIKLPEILWLLINKFIDFHNFNI